MLGLSDMSVVTGPWLEELRPHKISKIEEESNDLLYRLLSDSDLLCVCFRVQDDSSPLVFLSGQSSAAGCWRPGS